MPTLTPGTILGAYRIDGTIGSGSMGEVFRGIDTGLNRRVAIKILSEKHRDNPELRARFVREGRAVAAISHPNVVQVFATGSFDERPYIAMELLDGTDLSTSVEKGGPLDSLTAAHSMMDAAQGLAAAARAGLIHRDVKPSNLVRLVDGRVKVTDFGLAKPVDPGAEPALTAMGVVVGTPDYIAPEQARGEAIDERVDLYALGGTLYFLLTGIPPFRTGKPAEDKYLKVVARHLRNPPPDATVANPRADRELAELARALMAKKPADRPSYDEMIGRLTGILARLDPESAPVLVASRDRSRPITLPPGYGASRSLDDSATVSEPAPRELPKGRLPGWLVAFTFVCIALFVAGLVVYLRRGDGAEAAAVKPPAGSGSSAVVIAPIIDAPAADAPAAEQMLVVKKPDGTPWFQAAALPVTLADYKRLFARHEQSGKPDDAVVMISYNEARSYANTHGGRLLTSAEWDAAEKTAGFTAAVGTWEWVESPDEAKKTMRSHGKTRTGTDDAQKDVTFRMAKDL